MQPIATNAAASMLPPVRPDASPVYDGVVAGVATGVAGLAGNDWMNPELIAALL